MKTKKRLLGVFIVGVLGFGLAVYVHHAYTFVSTNNASVEAKTTLLSAQIGGTIESASILSSIKDGETLSYGKEENLASYIPMYDPTQSAIIGVIGIHQDLTVIQETKQQIIYIGK